MQLFLGVFYLFEFIFWVIVWIDKLHDFDERICFSNNDCHRTGKIQFSVIIITNTKKIELIESVTLREKCQYSQLFWSVFFRTRTENGEIWSISPYSVRMRGNTECKQCKCEKKFRNLKNFYFEKKSAKVKKMTILYFTILWKTLHNFDLKIEIG